MTDKEKIQDYDKKTSELERLKGELNEVRQDLSIAYNQPSEIEDYEDSELIKELQERGYNLGLPPGENYSIINIQKLDITGELYKSCSLIQLQNILTLIKK